MDTPTAAYVNRELSWLAFNSRVLELAEEVGIPLLERAKFVAITSSNLDEFFQVRVAALKDQIAAGVDKPTPDGRTPSQQLDAIGPVVRAFVEHQEELVIQRLMPALAAEGVSVVRWDDLSNDDQARLGQYYTERMFPLLTPLAVDPGHPFPYISNLALSIAATVVDPESGERRFVRLKIPRAFPRLVPLGDGRFVTAEEVIAAHLQTLFVGMDVQEWASFRVTRNADLTLEEDEADDLLVAVELELRKQRFNRPVRLEVHRSVSDEMLGLLIRELDIDERNVTRHSTFLDLSCLMQLHDLDRPDLKDRHWVPVTAGRIVAADEADRTLFEVVRDRALLLHHPYESFASSVEAFIAQAADDPAVQSIKMTLYRAGGDSPILRSLIRAAERGVQVAVLVDTVSQREFVTSLGFGAQMKGVVSLEEIERRQNCVGEFVSAPGLATELQMQLRGIRDLERILGRLQNRLRNPRELGGVRDTLNALPAIAMTLLEFPDTPVAALAEQAERRAGDDRHLAGDAVAGCCIFVWDNVHVALSIPVLW